MTSRPTTSTTPMTPSGSRPADPCGYEPCICTYIRDLRVGGRLEHLRPIALAEHAKPLPHRDGCPCPRCYAVRLATWQARP